MYSNLSREDWLKLPDSLKIPVFRTFSDSSKLNFWREKHIELMSMDWTNEEKEHIDKMYNYLYSNVNIFEHYTNSDAEILATDLMNKFEDWYNDSKNKLGWDLATIYAIVGTGDRVTDEFLRDLRGAITVTDRYNGGGYLCDCNSSALCVFWRMGYKCNKRANCNVSKSGCAPFWLYECNGSCEW